MNRTGFRYDVSAVLELAGHEIARLRRAAFSHYDAKCRAAVMPGGFLHGMSITALPSPNYPHPTDFDPLDGPNVPMAALTVAVAAQGEATSEHVIRSRDLQILAKIAASSVFGIAFRCALTEVLEESRRINDLNDPTD